MIRIKISRIPGVFKQSFHSTNQNCPARFSKIFSSNLMLLQTMKDSRQGQVALNYEMNVYMKREKLWLVQYFSHSKRKTAA